MPRPLQAQVWELWRLSRWQIFVTTFGSAALWSGVFCFLMPSGQSAPVDASFFTILVFMSTLMTSMVSSPWMNRSDNAKTGFDVGLGFTRPISTLHLVSVPMVVFSCIAALCYLLPSAFFCVLFGLPLPLFSAAALVASACGLLIMAVWSPRNRFVKLINFVVVMASLLTFLCFGIMSGSLLPLDVFTAPKTLQGNFAFSIWSYLIMLTLYAGSIAVTTLAIDRQRHGERWSSLRLSIDRVSLSGGLFKWHGPFSSSRHAQYWYEMRRSGAPLLMSGLVSAVLAFLGLLLYRASGGLEEQFSVFWWGVVLAVSPLVFLLTGAEWLLGLRRKPGFAFLPTFDATQAMDSRRLMFVKLVVLTGSVFLSWSFMALTAVLWTVVSGGYVHLIEMLGTYQPVLGRLSLPWWACAGFILFANYLTAAALALWFGFFVARRPKLTAAVFFAFDVYIPLFIFFTSLRLVTKDFWVANAWVLVAALAVALFLAWRKALREGYLYWKHFFASLCLWIVYISAAVLFVLHVIPAGVSIPSYAMALGIVGLLLPFILMAVSPLGLAAHRHR